MEEVAMPLKKSVMRLQDMLNSEGSIFRWKRLMR